MIDILYVFAHSPHGDEELRYSLRSVALGAPWVRKVWVFGDRPAWLSDDTNLVEHVPHEFIARLGRWKVPVRNHFLLVFLGSLIPELSSEFLFFCDDFVLLHPMDQADLCRVRVLEDLSQVKVRGKGLWKESLWATYDVLRRLGYGTLNFEVHVPQFTTRRQIFDAYCDLQDYVTEDRHYGIVCHTAVMNHALRKDPAIPLVWLHEENRRAGFYGPPKRPGPEGSASSGSWTRDEVAARCEGKSFLGFDDAGWGPGLAQFLAERFPEPSQFESSSP